MNRSLFSRRDSPDRHAYWSAVAKQAMNGFSRDNWSQSYSKRFQDTFPHSKGVATRWCKPKTPPHNDLEKLNRSTI